MRGLLNDEVDRHMLVHLFEATSPQPLTDPPLRPDVSEPLWEQLENLAPTEFVPGFHEIAHIVQAAEPSMPIYQDISVYVVPRD